MGGPGLSFFLKGNAIFFAAAAVAAALLARLPLDLAAISPRTSRSSSRLPGALANGFSRAGVSQRVLAGEGVGLGGR